MVPALLHFILTLEFITMNSACAISNGSGGLDFAKKLYVNFGFWGMLETKDKNGHYNRLIEKKVTALRGNKSLYSNAYYTESEFWSIYNKPLYHALKNKYDPENKLNTLYDKCVEKV